MARDPMCRSCGQPIVWSTILPSGKRVPLDPSPDPDCGVYRRRFITGPDGNRSSTVTQLAGPELDAARELAHRYPADPTCRLWVPHFASCAPRPGMTAATRRNR